MTDAGTLELVELDPALDWEHTPTCGVVTSGCEAQADFLEVNRCCGSSCYSCAPHRLEVDDYILRHPYYHCTACGAEKPVYEWKPIR